ncbi:50S ribosomal protein L25/general stress protein Ctc, partial [Flavonifractor plautii]|nr:50S ribosomal protein L25/general stress protein Ctc [Flavonifractor plautii]
MQLEIPYTSLPKYMIDTITIDVDGMKTGNVITVGEIPELQTEKIEIQVDPDNIVLRISEKQNNAVEAVEG